jgi:hypothetical protein
MGRQLQDIETSFVAETRGLGWTHVEAGLKQPTVTGRVRVTPLLAVGGP